MSCVLCCLVCCVVVVLCGVCVVCVCGVCVCVWCVCGVCVVCVCVWCVWVFYFSLSLSFSQFSSFSLSLSFSLSILFFLFLAVSRSFLLLSCLPLSLLSSSSFSSLFPSRQQTLCKALINKRDVQLRVGSLPSSSPPFSPSPPPQKKERELFITGIFPARNLFLITVLNKFQKLAAGENYSHDSFILIPKQ